MRHSMLMFGFGKKSVVLVFIVLFTGLETLYGQVLSTTLYSNKMTCLSSNTPTTPGGTDIRFFVGRESQFVFGGPTISFNYRSLLQFDLSDIEPNAIITSATLTLTRSGGVNPMQVIFARATSAWTESAATWNTPPTYQSADEISVTASNTSQTFDVKDHIQKMVSGTNNGWVLRGSVESGTNLVNRHYYSDHYSVATSHPRLDVSYYIPMSVTNATIVHANTSSPTETTGSISPVLINGPGGTYSYQWYNASGAMSGKTSLNLTGVPYGWYGLKVTSSIAGAEPFFYAFLVGVNCQEVSIEFNPGPDYIDDANLQKALFVSQNEVTNYYNSTDLNMYSGGAFSNIRSVLKYRLWLDEEMYIDDAVMSLTANYSYSNSNNPVNSGSMYVMTENWNEKIITYSNQPEYSLINPIPIPSLSSVPQTRQFDAADHFNLWRQNNSQNFGWLMKMNDESLTSSSNSQRYNSSDATSNRPKINFSISVSNPVAPNYCNQVFAKMDRTLRGVLYKPYLNHLYFYYDEEYNTISSSWVNYNVYKTDAPHTSILNHTLQPLTAVRYGDNRFTLDISDLDPATYVLEITNNKSEKFYLRFKVED